MTLKRNSATNKIKIFITIIFSVILTFSGAAFCQEKINIAVTDMWLALLASFIGGQEVNVIPIKIWNSNGDLVVAERGRILRELPSDAKIIALDKNDADTIKGLEDFNVCYLYSSFPV